jgi:hypothetical protein
LSNITRFLSGAIRSLRGSERGREIAQAYCPIPALVFDKNVERILRFVSNFRSQQSQCQPFVMDAEIVDVNSSRQPSVPHVADEDPLEVQAA